MPDRMSRRPCPSGPTGTATGGAWASPRSPSRWRAGTRAARSSSWSRPTVLGAARPATSTWPRRSGSTPSRVSSSSRSAAGPTASVPGLAPGPPGDPALLGVRGRPRRPAAHCVYSRRADGGVLPRRHGHRGHAVRGPRPLAGARHARGRPPARRRMRWAGRQLHLPRVSLPFPGEERLESSGLTPAQGLCPSSGRSSNRWDRHARERPRGGHAHHRRGRAALARLPATVINWVEDGDIPSWRPFALHHTRAAVALARLREPDQGPPGGGTARSCEPLG